jgi:hypothetical protein
MCSWHSDRFEKIHKSFSEKLYTSKIPPLSEENAGDILAVSGDLFHHIGHYWGSFARNAHDGIFDSGSMGGL